MDNIIDMATSNQDLVYHVCVLLMRSAHLTRAENVKKESECGHG